MSDTPYLVAHKVRDEPAFDIATRMECPTCHGVGSAGLHPEDTYEGPPCHECDGLGYWWIIPTSGHRAYPYYDVRLCECVDMYYMDGDVDKPMVPPPTLPDHYQSSRAPDPARPSLSALLGFDKPKLPPIKRRL